MVMYLSHSPHAFNQDDFEKTALQFKIKNTEVFSAACSEDKLSYFLGLNIWIKVRLEIFEADFFGFRFN